MGGNEHGIRGAGTECYSNPDAIIKDGQTLILDGVSGANFRTPRMFPRFIGAPESGKNDAAQRRIAPGLRRKELIANLFQIVAQMFYMA